MLNHMQNPLPDLETNTKKLNKEERERDMKQYRCTICGYVYDPTNGDPENGIKPGTAFEDLPDDWTCPICGATKDQFEPVE